MEQLDTNDSTKEIWVPCIASNNYEVSNLGRCRRIDTGKIVKPYSRMKRNTTYNLSDNGILTSYVAKYLIYESFNGLVSRGSYIHFKDNNSNNLCLDNLTLFIPVHVSFKEVTYKYLYELYTADCKGNLIHYIFEAPLIIGSDGSINGYIRQAYKSEYMRIQVKVSDGSCKCLRVHKLVAAAFLSDYDPYLYINHIDGNKHNNRIENLECIYPEDNTYHAFNVATPIDISMTYELKDENEDIYGCYHSFEEACKEMESYLVGGGLMHISAYNNNVA